MSNLWNPLKSNYPIELVNFNSLNPITQEFFLRCFNTNLKESIREEKQRYSKKLFLKPNEEA